MDKRDYLIGALATALVGTLILWGLSEPPEPSQAHPSTQKSEPPAPTPSERRAPPARGRPPADRTPSRPVQPWRSDGALDAWPPAGPPQEPYRYRPLGERERMRMEGQRSSGSPSRWRPDGGSDSPEPDWTPIQPQAPWHPAPDSDLAPQPWLDPPSGSDRWQERGSAPFQSSPERGASPSGTLSPSQRMYPSLDDPHLGLPASPAPMTASA